jgi:NAD(P)-dependent dehydrogenase (short-subunit alcohol dehydrogenase family)
MATVGIATGAGRGMGHACARLLPGLVDHVILLDMTEEAVVAAAAEIAEQAPSGVTVEPFVADVTDGDALARLAERAAELGTLRAVAHAAGISPSMADWRRIFEVDLIGTARLAEALRPLATAGTATVNFASMAAALRPPTPEDAALDKLLADPLQDGFLDKVKEAASEDLENTGAAYSLAKRGVKVFTQREAVRLGPLGARVVSVSPGLIDTPQGRQEAQEHPSMAMLAKATPLARTGQSAEVAGVVAFALSNEASFLSGIDLLVDGGVVAAITAARGGWLGGAGDAGWPRAGRPGELPWR